MEVARLSVDATQQRHLDALQQLGEAHFLVGPS